jgi:hypothetical protein
MRDACTHAVAVPLGGTGMVSGAHAAPTPGPARRADDRERKETTMDERLPYWKHLPELTEEEAEDWLAWWQEQEAEDHQESRDRYDRDTERRGG